MRSGSDAIPDAAGSEGGHGAARPDGVIHRYRVYRGELTPSLVLGEVK